MLDARGRPYFLWDADMTLEAFRAGLQSPDPAVRAYLLAKLMRQAKPDDVFQFVTLHDLQSTWAAVEPQLGQKRAFWRWLLEAWEKPGRALH
jgi:hypothetical protein